jgi:superfamily II DNA or RNA helicase
MSEPTALHERERAAVPNAGAGAPVPRARLFCGTVWGLGGSDSETAALIELSFDYDGVIVAATDARRPFTLTPPAEPARRDRAAERRARCTLEGLGAVDLDCMEEVELDLDVAADYLVKVDGDEHGLAEFTRHAVPQLERLGWHVEVDGDYPYQVVAGDLPWYAEVNPERQECPDWFSLELGVEVDGHRVNLLPALLELLDDSRGESLRAVIRSARSRVAVRVSDTHLISLPADRLKALLRVLVELYQEGSAINPELQLARQQAAALERLDAALGEVRWSGDTEIRAYGAALAGPPPPTETPGGLRATLRPYQATGLAWLQNLRAAEVGGVLADDMGLGKTLQTIAHLTAEVESGRADRLNLVVAPTSLVRGWAREFKKFAPGVKVAVWQGPKRHRHWDQAKSADVLVTSYPILLRDQDQFAELPLHFAVLDEAQTIKNRRSQLHAACKRLDARHRLCLSGTPLENHLGELWTLFDFINPGMLGDELGFRRRYRVPIEQLGDDERLAALREAVAPFILRRLKSQVATDLPPKTNLMHPVELSGAQRELYENIRVAAHDQVRRAIHQRGLAASTVSILDALMKLRQVCCDPRLVAMEAAHGVEGSAKYRALFEMLDKMIPEGHRVLIFSQFTSMLALVARGLQQRGVRHLSLTGSTPRRQEVIDRFESGAAEVFLISLKAGGTGLTLTSADTVIHYDPWWNPAAQDQATDRAYRIGQTRPVFVHSLFVAGSVEERMLALQRRKRRLAGAILDSRGGAGGLSETDVEVLFAPLKG